MSDNVAVVIGVGPEHGLGGAPSKRFAERGLHVFLAGRTQAKLDALARIIASNGGRATPLVANATREADVTALFDTACAAGNVELAIYNAGNNFAGPVKEMDAGYFEACWRICCLGGFLFGREAVRRMAGGSILFTGASASLRGRANFAAFNAAKSGLRAFAQALAKESAADGIHVGHVVVDGAIAGEKIKRGLPEVARRLGEDGMIDLDGIVRAYEFLHDQPRRAWTFELDLRTALERW